MQIEEYEGSDSNPYEGDSNLNSNKFAWRPRFESLFNEFESGFPKRSEWLLDKSDSNNYSMDSNPNSSKRYFDGLIQISFKKFKSLVKKEMKLRATDSNHTNNDSNPSWRTRKEIEARIRIIYIAIRIPESGVMKNKVRWFESSSYGFESLHKLKLKVRQSDSNLWVRIFELWIRIPSQIEAVGWRSDKAIRLFELWIRITP